MITAPVRVIAAENGVAQVVPTGQSGCGGCSSRDNCGISGLGKYFSGGRKAVEVRCDAGVRAGDELQFNLHEGDLLKAGLLAYLLPCVFALIGAGTVSALGFGDAVAALGAGIGLVAGLVSGRLSGWTPRIVVQGKHH